jgi:hypothetical protein
MKPLVSESHGCLHVKWMTNSMNAKDQGDGQVSYQHEGTRAAVLLPGTCPVRFDILVDPPPPLRLEGALGVSDLACPAGL